MGLFIINSLIIINIPPVVTNVIIVIQCCIVSLYSFAFVKDSWFLIVFIIVFVGGFITLLVYVSMLSNNDATLSNHWSIVLLLPVIYPYVIYGIYSWVIDSIEINVPDSLWLYSYSICVVIVYYIVFLFLILYVIVSLVEVFNGSLRSI